MTSEETGAGTRAATILLWTAFTARCHHPMQRCSRRAIAVELPSLDFLLLVPMARISKGPQKSNVQKQLNFIDNFAVTARAHQLKFGADFRHLNPASDSR